MRRRFWILAIVLLAMASAAPRTGFAQDDDWGVSRDPFNPKIVNRYKAILGKNPEDAVALKKLLELYGKYRTVDLLIKEYSKKADGGGWQPHQILGHIHRSRNNDKLALESYEKAAQLAPDQWSTHAAIGEMYRRRKEWERARQAFDKALATVKAVADKKIVLRVLADLALDAKDIARARELYAQLLALEPKNVQARIELAEALAKHKFNKDALAEFQKVETLVRSDPPRRAEILSRIGELQALTGDDDGAVATWRQAMGLTAKGHWLRKQLTEKIIEVYRNKDQLRSLAEYYEKEWPQGGRGYFEWDVLAHLYEELGDQEKALTAYRAAAKKAPYELETRKRLIALLERAGHHDEALREFEAVIKVAPGEPKFQLDLAERYWRKGEKKKALAMLAKMRSRFSGDAGVHAALADLYSRWGLAAEAMKEYEILTKVEPEDDSHLINLGEQHWQKNTAADKKKAIDIWKKIAKKGSAETIARLAEVYAEHELTAEALDMFQKAISMKKDDPQLYKGLAGVLERLRRDDDAIAAWEKVLDFAPFDAGNKGLRREARGRIIGIAARTGRLHAKIAQYKKKFVVDPKDGKYSDAAIDAGYFLSEAYLKLSPPAPKETIATLATILKGRPDDVDALASLVTVYKQQRMIEEAIATLLKLSELSPTRKRDYFMQIAELEQGRGRFEEAEKYANLALELSPNDAQAQEKLGNLYKDRSDYERAKAAYRRALEINDHAFKVAFALADLYTREKSERKLALELYRQIIKKAPDEEIIILAASKATEIAEYLEEMGDLERDLAQQAFLFPAKPVYRKQLVVLIDAYVPKLLREVAAGDKEAAKELVRVGEHGLQPLLEALADGEEMQQRIAVGTLGHLGNKSAAPALVRYVIEAGKTAKEPLDPNGFSILTTTPDTRMRIEALIAAGQLADARIVPELTTLLADRESAIREGAAWALGRTRSAKAIPGLIKTLTDQRLQTQMYACVALGAIGDKKAVPTLIVVVTSPQKGADVRAGCGFALGLIGDASPGTINALVTLLGEGNEEAQRKAAWALARVGDRKLVPLLLRAYFSKRDSVRDSIAWAIARVTAKDGGKVGAVPAWRDSVVLDGSRIHYSDYLTKLEGDLPSAALSAGLLAGAGAELANGLAEALTRHRDVVVRVLRDLDARERGLGLGILTADLDQLPAAKREAALAALDEVGKRIEAPVVALLEHRDSEVRRLSLSVAAKIGAKAASERVLFMLATKDAAMQDAALAAAPAAAAHGERGKIARATEVLLKSPRIPQRKRAADALGLIADAASEAPLIAALGDLDGFVRQAAAGALGRLGRATAIPALKKVEANDDSPEVRASATAAIKQLQP